MGLKIGSNSTRPVVCGMIPASARCCGVPLRAFTATDLDGDGIPDFLDPYPNDPLNAFDLRRRSDGLLGTADDSAIYPIFSTRWAMSVGLSTGFTIPTDRWSRAIIGSRSADLAFKRSIWKNPLAAPSRPVFYDRTGERFYQPELARAAPAVEHFAEPQSREPA